ncbi:MAG: hybrid sensor histidine kinase/response regulator [Janthinobacterium lividum]
MTTIHDGDTVRSSMATDNTPSPPQMSALVDEVAALRVMADEKEVLEALVGQLREANQNLVLATLNAQALQEEADAIHHKQQEHLSMLAHELRNPLGPISIAATLLGKTSNASPQELKLQQIIIRQTGHMSRLLDDLLDAARINSGKATLDIQPVRLTKVLEQAIEVVQPFLDDHLQNLAISLPPQDVMMRGDVVRLVQIFSNILINASKFTHDCDEISLNAETAGNNIVVRIQDHGMGIPVELLSSVFELFSQGPRLLARSEGGLGVGLYLVRNFVELHGGTVEMCSAGVGQGSVVTVMLPLDFAKSPPGRVEKVVAPRPRNLRILLIEDNPDAREAMSTFLEFEGYTVSVAGDGETGFLMVSNNTYDVLICDIGLPGMNGIELMHQLHDRGQGQPSLAIAMSGYGDALIRTRARDAGFDAYMVKPADGDVLLDIVAQAEQRAPLGGPRPSAKR